MNDAIGRYGYYLKTRTYATSKCSLREFVENIDFPSRNSFVAHEFAILICSVVFVACNSIDVSIFDVSVNGTIEGLRPQPFVPPKNTKL